ncbi:MAG TPA: trehalose-6-phosphate synthase [Aggregatilinea sp.]|jgi:trehalose 6-phosphate synthase|uniref:alpha,alpha-trehalose-phosphate synthase (UDP-forming) n=1 Tax=Aggregatilinea sp. TaxID=2806333 RepID=UPI002CE1F9C5|nr:trehalose-6-phosphate synthase [Aggregatilinea sp.]HML21527.1 trehalose-6-phosphate synthase [Aggregatilinea sp.]
MSEQKSSGGNEPLIVIASNRGPFSFTQVKNGGFTAQRGSGGLVTALGALAERHEVLWVAAALGKGDEAWQAAHGDQPADVEGVRLRLVRTAPRRYDQYYNVIANPLLWFIQHELWDIPRKPSITGETWKAWRSGYQAVNRTFAEAIADSVKDTDRPIIIFPQDYHLYLVPHVLREMLGERVQIQPFIHIPWPGPDAWRILPGEMRTAILTSLLASDRVGFQTQRDAFNFVQCCRLYVDDAHSHGSRNSIDYHGRRVEARTYPISIDIEKMEELAAENETRLLKAQMMAFVGDSKLILRVDRIEPSKNILRGLEAFRELLVNHPEHKGRVQMLALLVPSRMEVDEYQDYLQQIMADAGMINAEFSEESWEPVRILVGENYRRAIGAMQIYDVLLVNPIADGMNLVAKEGALVNQRDGVLLLSEHAGVFYELGEHALTVSPFDTYGTAEAMHQALTMPPGERHDRAEALRAAVKSSGVRSWFYAQLDDAMRTLSSQSKNASTS